MFGCTFNYGLCWLLFFTGLPDESGNMVATILLQFDCFGYERISLQGPQAVVLTTEPTLLFVT